MPPPKQRVLLVDDDPKFREFARLGLGECGIECTVAADASEARAILDDAERDPPQLVLLDVMMPGGSGWEVLRWIREKSSVPVIFVTAREAVEERVLGLQKGADDYIVKPFAFAELVARIEAVLRRRDHEQVLRVGELCLEPKRHAVTLRERRIDLSPKEFELLMMLAEARGRVLSRAEMLRDVWSFDADPETNVVDVHIARLRRKLDQPDKPMIRTVRGEGYALWVPHGEER